MATNKTRKAKSKAKKNKKSLTKEEIEIRTKERIKDNNIKYAMKIMVGVDNELKSMNNERKKAEDLIVDYKSKLNRLEDLKLRIEGAIISLEKVKSDATKTETES